MTTPARVLGAVVVLVAPWAWACSDEGADPEAFCARAADTSAFVDTFDESFDPLDVGGALVAFTTARDTERELRAIAPEAIRSDIDVIIDYLDQLIDGLEAAEPGSDERPAIYDDLRSRADEIEAASARIARYVDTNC